MPAQPIPENFNELIDDAFDLIAQVREKVAPFRDVENSEFNVIDLKLRNTDGALERIRTKLTRKSAAVAAGETLPDEKRPPDFTPVEGTEVNGADESDDEDEDEEAASPYHALKRDQLEALFNDAQLAEIQGTGADGYVTRNDLLAAAERFKPELRE